MLGHECPEAVSPERGVVLTDLQSSLMVNKLLSLSLARARALSLSLSHLTGRRLTVTGADPGIILSVFVAQLVGRLVSDGFWEQDYGWVRVGRPFGARRRSSVRYGTRLGDLKESWFILFSN